MAKKNAPGPSEPNLQEASPANEARAAPAPEGNFAATTLPGAERLTKLVETTAKYGQAAMGQQVEAMNALSQARSPQDVVTIQADYSRRALEAYLAHSAQMAQLMTEFVASSSKLMTQQAENVMRKAQIRSPE